MTKKPVKLKNRNRIKKTGHKNQTRKFFLLFFTFWIIFFILWKLADNTPGKKNIVKPVQDTIQVITPVFTAEEDTLSNMQNESDESQITYYCLKLGVLESLIKVKEKDNEMNVFIPLNAAKLDLNFANFFFTKNLTVKGWRLLTGVENTSGNTQKLTFYSKRNKKVHLNLYYDKSKAYPPEKQKIVVIITELGEMSEKKISELFKIRYPLNFAVLPDRKYTESLINVVTKSGYELLINIPMEPIDYPMTNPGEKSLFVKMSEKQIKDQMEEFYQDFPEAKGTINYMGSLVTTDETVSKVFLSSIKSKNLYFVDNLDPTSSLAFNCAQKMVLTSYKRSLTLRLKDQKSLNTALEDIRNKRGEQNIIINIPVSNITNVNLLVKLCESLEKEGLKVVFGSKLEEEI